MPMVETELKLAVTPRTLVRIAQDPLLAGSLAPAQPLLAIYFDTSRRALWKRGVVLRARRDGDGWQQTIKGAGSLRAGLHQRAEITQPLAGPEPDLALLGGSEPEKAVAAASRGAKLIPVFRTEFERLTGMVSPAADVAIEVSLDRGKIVGDKARAPICEVELELKQGPASALFELARALAARYPLRIEPRSKAERGFELIGAVQPAPVRGSLRVIRHGMTAAEAFRTACTSCLDHLQANQAGVIRGADPEFLHQARVALRRLRSVIEAFDGLLPVEQTRARMQGLRRLTRSLGPARDWDVFVLETLAPVLQQFPGHRGLEAIERGAGRLREAAGKSARRALGGRRAQALLLDLGAWLGTQPWLAEAGAAEALAWRAPVSEHAAVVLAQYHRRTLKRGRGIRSAGLGRLHRLRIAAKRLRYAAGFFAPLFPKERVRPMLGALNDLQDALGAINDCAIAPRLIDAASAASRGPLRPQARTIVGHWNAAMLAERREGLRRSWKAVRKCPLFWK